MRMKAYPIMSRIKGLKEVNTMLSSLRRYSQSEVAQQRMKIIKFYQQYGEEATKEAFGADRKVISRWRKRLTNSRGKLSALVPTSTRPHTVRTARTDPLIVEFIRKAREAHPRIGKEKLKPDLDIYCIKNGIATVSVSTIGNIIKRKQFFFQKSGRVYHNPSSKWAQRKVKKRVRVKHSPKPQEYGYILADTVERITDGVKNYYMSAIDAKMKFALTLRYKRNTSTNMKDLYERFKQVYPGEIKIWQTDNGSENLGVFDQQLKKDKIPHVFIYPHCPKVNTYIERYNRTVQEEFIDYHEDIVHDPVLFGQKLAEWNIYYNTKRRHHSLGLKSPLQYLVDNGGMSHMSLTYTPTTKLMRFPL